MAWRSRRLAACNEIKSCRQVQTRSRRQLTEDAIHIHVEYLGSVIERGRSAADFSDMAVHL